MQFLLAATFAALAVAMPPSYGSSAPSYGGSAPSYGESAPAPAYGESSAPAPQYKAPATTPAAEYPAAQTSAAVVPVAAAQICTAGWSAQCCQTDVLGLAALTCKARMCFLISPFQRSGSLNSSSISRCPHQGGDGLRLCHHRHHRPVLLDPRRKFNPSMSGHGIPTDETPVGRRGSHLPGHLNVSSHDSISQRSLKEEQKRHPARPNGRHKIPLVSGDNHNGKTPEGLDLSPTLDLCINRPFLCSV